MSSKQYIDKYGLAYPYYDQYQKYVKRDMEQSAKVCACCNDKLETGRKLIHGILNNNRYTDIVESTKTDRAQRYEELVKKLVDVGLVDPSYHPDTVQEILISLIGGR